MFDVVKVNPCDDCGIKGLYENCKDKCVQYRKWHQYQQGRADEQKRFIKIFADFFGDEPCNYNCMDEFTDNEWCECHCGKSEHTVLECWEHAINSGWLEQLKEQNE